MAVMWTVWPLDGEMTQRLTEQGIDFPDTPSRFPTGSEIQHVLGEPALRVRGHSNGLGKTWSAIIERDHNSARISATLVIEEYTGDDQPQQLYFEKGDETLIRMLLKRLAAYSGPLVLIDDAGDQPQVINSEQMEARD